MLPENKKVDRKKSQKMKMWLYGEAMVGKTIFANNFPNAIFLNTDGNVTRIDSPVLSLRPTKDKDVWEVFVDAVNELLTTEHKFETIVVDLLEDVHQACRQHFYKKQGMDHESDQAYGKGWDIVKNSFLIVLVTLLNSDFNIVLLSREKEKIIKTRTGIETTIYQPDIQDNVMGKIGGIVQLAGRIKMDYDENKGDYRVLYLNSTKEQFGGNRLEITEPLFIPLDYKQFEKVYKGGEK